MKKRKIIAPLLLIILFITLGILIYFYFQNNTCSFWHPEKCNKFCNTNEDCRIGENCDCMNKNETCETCKRAILGKECVQASCAYNQCSCINNQCTENKNP